MSDTEIVSTRSYDTTVDEYLSNVVLSRTMQDVVSGRECANNAKAYTINGMIFNAVFELDVELIRTLTTRVDGTVPEEGKREGCANLLGDAIEDVLSYDDKDLLKVLPSDPPIIAMAKVLVYVSTQPAGTNMARRRERNLATQMILERTGGRKVKPTKPMLETKYVEPDWMGLPDGESGSENSGGMA